MKKLIIYVKRLCCDVRHPVRLREAAAEERREEERRGGFCWGVDAIYRPHEDKKKFPNPDK